MSDPCPEPIHIPKWKVCERMRHKYASWIPVAKRMGDDGKPQPVHGVAGEFTMGRPPALVDGDEQIAPFAFPFDGLQFREAGMFSWVISIDGEETARLPMRVKLAQQA